MRDEVLYVRSASPRRTRRSAAIEQLAATALVFYDAGHLRPVIDKKFPFAQALEALAYVEQGRANGKVVITLD